ncbi:MAG: ABC transporter permease [Vulcanimicrobiaceae bacterium]
MRSLGLIGIYARLMFLEIFRTPAYVVPTVVFPALFFAMFALPWARTPGLADTEMLSFVAIAVIGVTLFQFGVGVAAERARPWERYLRTLPANVAIRFAARSLCALLFGALAGACVVVVARLFSPIDLNGPQWALLALYAVLGGIPFVLFGITIGYWSNARAAVAIANLCYMLLAFAGGLWMPPTFLPAPIALVSPYLPTRAFGELLWSIAGAGHASASLVVLAAYTALFTMLATIGYRRDEQARYV